jgi:hypothetical protein
MSLRLWVRFRDRLWGWDDLFVLLAGIASIVGDSFVCLSECSQYSSLNPCDQQSQCPRMD